jgi:4-hydroxy-3-methylbut-2-en-1-yl diphosphate synthase IspG/GcpE
MQRGLPAAKDQRYPFLGVNKAGAAASAAIKSSIALMPIAPE